MVRHVRGPENIQRMPDAMEPIENEILQQEQQEGIIPGERNLPWRKCVEPSIPFHDQNHHGQVHTLVADSGPDIGDSVLELVKTFLANHVHKDFSQEQEENDGRDIGVNIHDLRF